VRTKIDSPQQLSPKPSQRVNPEVFEDFNEAWRRAGLPE